MSRGRGGDPTAARRRHYRAGQNHAKIETFYVDKSFFFLFEVDLNIALDKL